MRGKPTIRLRPRSLTADGGNVLIEFAIVLPIFLVGLLFLVWVGTLFNARSSVTAGVSKAVRLAATRGELPSSTLITSARFSTLLHSNDIAQDVAEYYHDGHTTFPVFGRSLGISESNSTMPDAYRYALVYFYEYMRQSVGPKVRFPCDPNDTDLSTGGPGCVSCEFLNPTTKTVDVWTDAPPTNKLAMRCSFRLPDTLTSILRRLIRMASGSEAIDPGIITREAYMDLSEST